MSFTPLDNPVITKQRVAANFDRAAKTYDAAAVLQKRVAARAMLGLPSELQPERVLDLGSGTGSQTPLLASHYPKAQIVSLDMAMGMLQYARSVNRSKPLSWCSGDIEALPFTRESFDVAFSSLAIQWCQLSLVLAEIERILKPGGWFIFSTLAMGTMGELRRAWSAVDRHVHVNGFESLDVQRHKIQQSGFEIQSYRQQTETLYYDSVNRILRELKALGVNTVHSRGQGLMTRSRLMGLQQAYEAFRQDRGLPLSYKVVYGVLRKS
ncbi:MAG: malonyl-ACP O-methyltransferase BioC [Endozoicomonas sp.]